MGTHENVRKICEYLQALGFSSASERIQEAVAQSFDDPLALVSLEVGGASRDSSGLGALEEGLISS